MDSNINNNNNNWIKSSVKNEFENWLDEEDVFNTSIIIYYMKISKCRYIRILIDAD